jgi:hypothetical protein
LISHDLVSIGIFHGRIPLVQSFFLINIQRVILAKVYHPEREGIFVDGTTDHFVQSSFVMLVHFSLLW